MEREHAEVEPHQLAVTQHVDQPAGCTRHRGGDRDRPQQHANRAGGEHSGEPEDAVHADRGIEQRRRHHREREHQADRGADHRHHLGAVLVAGEVGGERGDRGGDRARALQHAADDDHVDAVGERRDHAADDEQHQAEDDHRLAPEAVGRRPVGDLQAGLGEAVGADREAHQGEIVATGNLGRVDGEHRQDQEQAEHAQGEDRGEAHAGAAFFARHRVACGNGHTGNRLDERAGF